MVLAVAVMLGNIPELQPIDIPEVRALGMGLSSYAATESLLRRLISTFTSSEIEQ